MWFNGIACEKIKPLKEFTGKLDLHTTECTKALSNARAIMKHLSKYFPQNFDTMNSTDKDACISQSYQKLVNDIRLCDTKARNYYTMSYSSFFTLLSETGILKRK